MMSYTLWSIVVECMRTRQTSSLPYLTVTVHTYEDVDHRVPVSCKMNLQRGLKSTGNGFGKGLASTGPV